VAQERDICDLLPTDTYEFAGTIFDDDIRENLWNVERFRAMGRPSSVFRGFDASSIFVTSGSRDTERQNSI
jgi:hypothetical protein